MFLEGGDAICNPGIKERSTEKERNDSGETLQSNGAREHFTPGVEKLGRK